MRLPQKPRRKWGMRLRQPRTFLHPGTPWDSLGLRCRNGDCNALQLASDCDALLFPIDFCIVWSRKKNERKTRHDPASFFVPQECGNEMAGQFTPGISFPHFLAQKTCQDRGSQMLLLNKKHIKTVSISHIKKHQTLSYQTCDCLKTANIPANSSFLRCVAACVCDDVRMSLWHLQANDGAGQLGLRLHVGWTRR